MTIARHHNRIKVIPESRPGPEPESNGLVLELKDASSLFVLAGDEFEEHFVRGFDRLRAATNISHTGEVGTVLAERHQDRKNFFGLDTHRHLQHGCPVRDGWVTLLCCDPSNLLLQVVGVPCSWVFQVVASAEKQNRRLTLAHRVRKPYQCLADIVVAE